MKNIKISVRLFGLTTMLCLAMMLSGWISLLTMRDLHSNTEVISQIWLPAVVTAEELQFKISEYRLGQSSHIVAGNSMDKSKEEEELRTIAAQIETLFSEYSNHYTTGSTDGELIQTAYTLWTKYQTYNESLFTFSNRYNTSSALSVFGGEAGDIYSQMCTAFSYLVSYNTEGAELAQGQGSIIYAWSRGIVFFIGFIFTIVGLVMSYHIIISITRPIDEIAVAASKIAKGDLSAIIEYEATDKLGNLANSMRQLCNTVKTMIGDLQYVLGGMAMGDFTVEPQAKEAYVGEFQSILISANQISNQLSSTLLNIDQSSGKVFSGSQQMAHAAKMSAEGANKQAGVVDHLHVTLNKIVKRTTESTERSMVAKDKANMAATEVGASSEQVSNMTKSMERITDKSNEIAKIIKVIDEIAFQTNILALNAAVEAARAGTAGKGFAVVADEVRNLADKSASSAQDTSKLIDDTLIAVQAGTKVAEQTASSIYNVRSTILEVTEIMDDMVRVSDKQQKSLQEITDEVEVISSVVRQNTGSAEESALTSQELNGESNLLKSYVEQFKLK